MNNSYPQLHEEASNLILHKDTPTCITLADREAEIFFETHQGRNLLNELEQSLANPSASPESPLIGEQAGQVSEAGYQLIVQFETGGRPYYENVYRSAPVWPGYSSGITIGFGFDLGYNNEAGYRLAWANHLSEENFQRMKNALGFRTIEPNRAEKVEKARRLVSQFSDIRIPWGTAETVFVEQTLPKFVRLLLASITEARLLPADCFGSLTSLVFNRGASFNSSGPRYREMREIKQAIAANQLHLVPDALRSMKRLWPSSTGSGGLQARREKEALLWERGLATISVPSLDMPFSPILAISSDVATDDSWESVVHTSGLPATVEADWYDSESIRDAQIQGGSDSLDLLAETVGDVRWAHDSLQPDFRHLDNNYTGVFEFTAEHLEVLLRANHFNPDSGQDNLLFGLRGCRLAGGSQMEQGQSKVILEDIRPDHRRFSCVIGVYHRPEMTLSVFTGSTVPNRGGVLLHFNRNRNSSSVVDPQCNVLPCGMHPHVVGTHNNRYPGCFLQGTSFGNRLRVVVLRSHKDVVYDTGDVWHDWVPHDNIHPAFSTQTADFSSVGCTTVKGSFSNGMHHGQWAEFRRAAGLTDNGNHDGRRYTFVLLTGLEALLASRLSSQQAGHEVVKDNLWRLRHGSTGDAVRRLQAALGITQPDGSFGAITKMKLVNLQRSRLGWADGIYSPEMEELLGIHVFA
ncbi:MAG: hypothetical protein ACRCXD_03860 [Luteolibacter sp.]